MINVVHASREGGIEPFCLPTGRFGWKSIEKLWERELELSKRGMLRRVPKLTASFIGLDSCTKLEVVPAKIMIQPNVIAELTEYAASIEDSDPAESQETQNLIKFFKAKAMNLIFKEGFLSRKPCYSPMSATCQDISQGYQFAQDRTVAKVSPPTNLFFP